MKTHFGTYTSKTTIFLYEDGFISKMFTTIYKDNYNLEFSKLYKQIIAHENYFDEINVLNFLGWYCEI